jgi:hypothetical protein
MKFESSKKGFEFFHKCCLCGNKLYPNYYKDLTFAKQISNYNIRTTTNRLYYRTHKLHFKYDLISEKIFKGNLSTIICIDAYCECKYYIKEIHSHSMFGKIILNENINIYLNSRVIYPRDYFIKNNIISLNFLQNEGNIKNLIVNPKIWNKLSVKEIEKKLEEIENKLQMFKTFA